MLIIDTDKNIHSFLKSFDNDNKLDLILADKSELLIDFCVRIIEKKPEILLINIDAPFENSLSDNLKALDLLYWLRCKHNFKKPILLCSFLNIDKVRSLKPKHTLIDSEGVTFLELPFNLETAKLEVDVYEISDERLLEHVKGMFYFKRLRHENANWWSMKKLLDCHSLIHNVTYPNIVHHKLKHLNNALASFIYKTIDLYEEDLKKKLEKRISDNSKAIEVKQKIKENIIKEITLNKNLLFTAKSEEDKQNYRWKIDQLNKKLETFHDQAKILMIDDNALEGWQSVQEQIVGDKNKCLDAITYDFTQKEALSFLVKDLWVEVDKYLKSNQVEFVFLDLMLFPNCSKHDIKEQYSGLKILKQLKDNYNQIPILVTSASNKIWNLELAMSYGADAYWIKEGIESNYNFTATFANYEKLLHFIESFTSFEYKILRKFKEITSKGFKNEIFWWRNKKWAENSIPVTDKGVEFFIPKNQPVDKNDLFDYLNSFSKLLNVYIYETVILNKTLTNKDKQSHFTSLSVIIGKVIELIHPSIREKNKYLSTGAIIQFRGDKQASELYKLRNRYSHNSSKKTNTNSFFVMLNQFYTYLFVNDVIIDNIVKEEWSDKRKKDAKIIKDKILDKQKTKELISSFQLSQPKQIISKTKIIHNKQEINDISNLLKEQKAIGHIVIHYKD